jgi:hypothetical protein
VPNLVKIWSRGSGEEVENVKVYRQTDRQTDGQTDGRRTTGDQKSLLELSAKKQTSGNGRG